MFAEELPISEASVVDESLQFHVAESKNAQARGCTDATPEKGPALHLNTAASLLNVAGKAR